MLIIFRYKSISGSPCFADVRNRGFKSHVDGWRISKRANISNRRLICLSHLVTVTGGLLPAAAASIPKGLIICCLPCSLLARGRSRCCWGTQSARAWDFWGGMVMVGTRRFSLSPAWDRDIEYFDPDIAYVVLVRVTVKNKIARRCVTQITVQTCAEQHRRLQTTTLVLAIENFHL